MSTYRIVRRWRGLRGGLPTVMVAALVAASMAWLDAPVTRAVARLPAGVIETFNELTDFGRGAWPLTPLGLMLLATPFLCVPRLGFMSRGVLTAEP